MVPEPQTRRRSKNGRKSDRGSCVNSPFAEWLYFWPFYSSAQLHLLWSPWDWYLLFLNAASQKLECERECSRGEDYRLIKLTVTDYNSKRERDIVIECRGHDAAKICTPDHAHGWQKDVVGMLEEKHGKRKMSVHFECETLKADKAAEDHLRKFMPKLVGMDAVVNIGRMTIMGLEFEADAESKHGRSEQNDPASLNVAVCEGT